MLVVLMPLSQYKKNDLYRHVETFELANPKLFQDAVITENLCICTLKKDEVNKYTGESILVTSYDSAYQDYYKYNLDNYAKFLEFKFKNIAATPEKGYNNIEATGLDKQLFIHRRCTHNLNRTTDNYAAKLYSGVLSIRDIPWQPNQKNKKGGYSNYMFPLSSIILENKKAKENCYLWMQNTFIMDKLMAGLHTDGTTKLAWPQIDWSNIHINQKELWDKGDYDEAVLDVMGLKFDENGVIVKC